MRVAPPSDKSKIEIRNSKIENGLALLLDICAIFTTIDRDRLATRDLIDALNTQFTDRPWMETRKGQRSTEMWLAEQLRPFGIKAHKLRHQNTVLRGYHRDDFTEAFRRYIPASELDALRAQAKKQLAEKDEPTEPAT